MSDSNEDDMDTPITKREALELFITKRDFHDVMKNLFDYLDKRFDAIDKRFETESVNNAAEHAATRTFVTSEIDKSESRMKSWFGAELAQHTGTVDERHRTELSVIDDKYKELPERVSKLEAAVFPAPPAKRQRRR
jgi:hypothetical protein